MTLLAQKKVLLLTNIPRPYRTPLFAQLNQSLSEQRAGFKVVYYSDPKRHTRREGQDVRDQPYPYTWAAGSDIRLGFEKMLSIPSGLLPALQKERPDVLISGTFGLPGFIARAYCWKKNIPYIQWTGGIQDRKSLRNSVTDAYQGWLARSAQSCITYGTAAGDKLLTLGVNPNRIVVGINTVDTSFFAGQLENEKAALPQFIQDHRLKDCHILYVGSLVPRKGAYLLLPVMQKLIKEGLAFNLHFVGGGPEEEILRNKANAIGLGDVVRFWGFLNPAELSRFYALADIFVFPSVYEVWGLVLNEAMASGVPVIASKFAGATRDLVLNGENGFVVDPQDPHELTAAIRSLLLDPDLRKTIGRRASKTIHDKAQIKHSVNTFLETIRISLE